MCGSRAAVLGLLACWAAACTSHGPVTRGDPLAYSPPSWAEREATVRQSWAALLRRREEREQALTRIQAEEAAQDMLRQMPRVSLTSGGHATLGETVMLLLAGTGYSVEYEPDVDLQIPVATYIAYQPLHEALATVVQPLGYHVRVDPLKRKLKIASLVSRTWRLPAASSDDAVWTRLENELHQLVDGVDSLARRGRGSVIVDRDHRVISVSAPLSRMEEVETFLARYGVERVVQEEDR